MHFEIGQGAAAAAWRRIVAASGRAATILRGLTVHGNTTRRKAPQAVTAPRPLRPAIVPASLDELRGPADGVTELPVRLYWSGGSRHFDLADPNQAADLCEAVLDAASSIADVTAYLNADVLARAWPALGMSRAKREAWESRFPSLRRQRLAAAA